MLKVVAATVLPGYRIHIQFDTGEYGVIDVSDLAGHGVFAAWNDPKVFAAATVTTAGAVEWPGEIDLCPESLYRRLTPQ